MTTRIIIKNMDDNNEAIGIVRVSCTIQGKDGVSEPIIIRPLAEGQFFIDSGSYLEIHEGEN